MANISFIGAGNLAGSLIRGLIKHGFDISTLSVADLETSKTNEIKKSYPGIRICTSNQEAVENGEVLIACVKPNDLRGVCEEISQTLQSHPTVLVSVAAGVTLAMLTKWTCKALPLIRCMPNTPVSVGYGMSVLYAGADVSQQQHNLVDEIFTAVGATTWIENETLMDAITAISGSGPAYFFRVIEALERSAINLGIDAETAQKLITQTALGAATLVHQSKLDVKKLRAMVTSKGGTTERAITSLEQSDIDTIFEQAVTAATDCSREISNELDKNS